jgi:hypothetical protein
LAIHASIYVCALRLLPNSVDEVLSAALGPINAILREGIYHQRLLCELSDALLEAASSQQDSVSPDAALASYAYVVQLLEHVANRWPLVPKLQLRKAIAELETARLLTRERNGKAAAAIEKSISTAKAIVGPHADRVDALVADAEALLATIGEIDRGGNLLPD